MLSNQARMMIVFNAVHTLPPDEVMPVLSALLIDVDDQIEERLVKWRDEHFAPAIRKEHEQQQQTFQQSMSILYAEDQPLEVLEPEHELAGTNGQ